MDYFHKQKKVNKHTKLESQLLLGNRYIEIINDLYSKFRKICDEEFIEVKGSKKKNLS